MILIEHEALVRNANRLPLLPQSAARLAQLLIAEDPDLREIVSIIEFDSTLTMKLLRIANSAIAGARHQIGSVREAVVRLGSGAMAGFAIGASVRPLMGKRIAGYDLSEEEFWNHSLAAAFAAESIQAHATKWHSRLAFTAALLHDIGKLVLGQFLSAEITAWLKYAVTEGKLSAFEAENEILSLNHADTGGLIAQHWGLPDTLVKGIIYHHDPKEGDDGIGYATCLANLIAKRIQAEQLAEGEETPAWAADEIGLVLTRLGLAEEHLEVVCADARAGLQAGVGKLE